MNLKRADGFLLLFWVATLCNLLGQFQESHFWANLSKPILMPSLALYFISASKSNSKSFVAWVVLALFFCWLGDVFLMWVVWYELFFVAGLLSFLLGHGVYIKVYAMASSPSSSAQTFYSKALFATPFLVYALLFFMYLFPHLGKMQLPVLFYTLVITSMGIAAVNRQGQTSPDSFVWVLIGASLFILSDSLIALNKFVNPFTGAGFWIMLTYTLGQWSIVRGLLKTP